MERFYYWGDGFGGGITVGSDNNGWFLEGTAGFGSGAGITINPWVSFSGKANPCGGAGYVGIGATASASGPVPYLGGKVGIGGSGNFRGALGYTTQNGKLTSAFSGNDASLGFDGVSPGTGIGVGAVGGVQIGYSWGSKKAGGNPECECLKKP